MAALVGATKVAAAWRDARREVEAVQRVGEARRATRRWTSGARAVRSATASFALACCCGNTSSARNGCRRNSYLPGTAYHACSRFVEITGLPDVC